MSPTGTILLVFALLGVAYALPFFFAARGMDAERKTLLAKGALAEAEVLGYERVEEGLLVHYRFLPAGRASPVECRRLASPDEPQFTLGTKVPVRYKASHPSISILVPYARSQSPT